MAPLAPPTSTLRTLGTSLMARGAVPLSLLALYPPPPLLLSFLLPWLWAPAGPRARAPVSCSSPTATQARGLVKSPLLSVAHDSSK
jgi:hypothetical protein